MHRKYLTAGFSCLVIAAYLDNIRGPLLPVLSRELNLTYAMASWFVVSGNLSAVVTNYLLIPLMRRFREVPVTIALCAIGVFAVLLALVTKSWPVFIVFAMLLGSTVASLGVACNLLTFEGTTHQNRSRFLCALHMMYGFGSLLGPVVAGFLVDKGFHWSIVVSVAIVPLVALIAFLKAAFGRGHVAHVEGHVRVKFRFAHVMMLLIFCLYVVGETLTSMWMVAYLVEFRKLPLSSATGYLSGFFLFMGLSRMVCFASFSGAVERLILFASLLVSIVFLMLGHAGYNWSLCLAGLLGPFFPLFLARVTRDFGAEAKPLTVWMLTLVQLCLASSHLVVGRLTDIIGPQGAYVVPGVFLALAVGLIPVYEVAARKYSAG